MKLPIPNDWNGENWHCVQLQWPDSPLWFAILNGLIAGMAAGRAWDERDGSIRDVQAIGREIWARSIPFQSCDDSPIVPPVLPPIDTVSGGGGFWYEGDFEMPCIDISSLIKLEGGHLWVRDGCCEWVDKGAVGDFVEELITTPPGEEADPPIPFSACGKAKAILDAIYTVAQAMWGATTSEPWEWVSAVKDASAPMTIKAKYALEGVLLASQLKVMTQDEEGVFDDLTYQAILCRLARTLSADTGALSAANIASINEAFNQNMELESGLFNAAGNALGLAQLSNISMAGQLNQDADCECPELVAPLVPPTDGAWFTGQVTKTEGDGVIVMTNLSSDMRKISLRWLVGSPGEQFTDLGFIAHMAAPDNLTSMTLKLTGQYPLKDWHNLPYDRWDNPHVPRLTGVEGDQNNPVEGIQDSTGSTWTLNFTSGKPTGYEAGSTNTARFLPQDTRPNGGSMEFAIEIMNWE